MNSVTHSLQHFPMWCMHCVWQALLALFLLYHELFSNCELVFLLLTLWSMHFSSAKKCDTRSACWKLCLLFFYCTMNSFQTVNSFPTVNSFLAMNPMTHALWLCPACCKLFIFFFIVLWTLFSLWTLLCVHLGIAQCDTNTACFELQMLFFYFNMKSFLTMNSFQTLNPFQTVNSVTQA